MKRPAPRHICPKCGSVAVSRLPSGEGLMCERCDHAARIFPTSLQQPCDPEWDGRPRDGAGRVLAITMDEQ
jgi:hypothetical protein